MKFAAPPSGLPPPPMMGLCQAVREAARILGNCGGADRGAVMSEQIAERLLEIFIGGRKPIAQHCAMCNSCGVTEGPK